MRRFVPDPAVARRSNLTTALVVAAAMPLIGWVKDVTDPWLLGGSALTAAALTYGFYAWLARRAGLAVIEIGPGHLAIERQGRRDEIPWAEVDGVRFGIYGGDTLAIGRRAPAKPLHLRLDGHRAEAIREMKAALAERTAPR